MDEMNEKQRRGGIFGFIFKNLELMQTSGKDSMVQASFVKPYEESLNSAPKFD